MILTAYYDLKFGPVSFDFVTWLGRAMLERDARGCDGLHVVIVPKEDGVGGFSRDWGGHDADSARWRLWNIVMAACPLAGATVTLAASRFQADRLRQEPTWWPEGAAHHEGPLVDAARAGKPIPRLQATPAAMRHVEAAYGTHRRPLVTLTLRDQDSDPARNSDAAAWRGFEHWLMGRGYQVVRVDESRRALDRGFGYAELSVDLRLALYERADMNCIGNNGPAVLLHLSDAPYLQFGMAFPTAQWAKHYAKVLHLQVGDQLPWATPSQRLVYRPDTFEVLVEEFERWAGATS